ncbi:exodeoxyribonuclease VII small subunit [Salinicoccus cyprini]|uniref:Exodeoxyribonuclease 7 small subunit n=1 Tax=Salinicoccus cyprini TaxID=2493691 RepID=A0A558AYZ3_9STAP|nr:exodeoxyribonuclease VII small subunit [Salinicoccus cyprini]TVT29489.1 exodeoxyribonuclease VII small subunit [Salinicoccus cyprini]
MAETENETFEEKMKQLEQIVKQLDEDEVSLEASLKLYQKGVELTAECEKILKDAELKVETLNRKGVDDEQ